MSRYFEIIITGRQLAALVAGVALLLAIAFGLGVAVRVLKPAPEPTAAAAPAAVPAAVLPSAAPVGPTPAAAVATPTPTATATPTPVPPPPPTATPVPRLRPAARPSGRWVQVAALARHGEAEGVRNRVIALGFAPRQVVVQAAAGKFRIRLGPFPDAESAGRVAARLRAERFRGAFVVRPGE